MLVMNFDYVQISVWFIQLKLKIILFIILYTTKMITAEIDLTKNIP